MNKPNHLFARLIVCFFAFILVVAFAAAFISKNVEEKRKFPEHRAVEALLKQKDWKDAPGFPVIREPYAILYANNAGKWLDCAYAFTRDEKDHKHYIREDYPGSVANVSDARTVILLKPDLYKWKISNNHRWSNGDAAYFAPLMMTVYDTRERTRSETVEIAEVLLNHDKTGLYNNQLSESKDQSFDLYTKIKKYIR